MDSLFKKKEWIIFHSLLTGINYFPEQGNIMLNGWILGEKKIYPIINNANL